MLCPNMATPQLYLYDGLVKSCSWEDAFNTSGHWYSIISILKIRTWPDNDFDLILHTCIACYAVMYLSPILPPHLLWEHWELPFFKV